MTRASFIVCVLSYFHQCVCARLVCVWCLCVCVCVCLRRVDCDCASMCECCPSCFVRARSHASIHSHVFVRPRMSSFAYCDVPVSVCASIVSTISTFINRARFTFRALRVACNQSCMYSAHLELRRLSTLMRCCMYSARRP